MTSSSAANSAPTRICQYCGVVEGEEHYSACWTNQDRAKLADAFIHRTAAPASGTEDRHHLDNQQIPNAFVSQVTLNKVAQLWCTYLSLPEGRINAYDIKPLCDILDVCRNAQSSGLRSS